MRDIDEFACVFPSAYDHDTCDLDRQERDYREHQRDVEICVDASEQGRERSACAENPIEPTPGVNSSRLDGENEQKDRCQVWEKFAREVLGFRVFGDVIIDELDEPLEEKLEASGGQLKSRTDPYRDDDQDRKDRPAGNERVGYRQSKERAELLWSENDLYS